MILLSGGWSGLPRAIKYKDDGGDGYIPPLTASEVNGADYIL